MINAGDNKEPRAGVYVHQPSGYRAFIPKPLPPTPLAKMENLFGRPIITVATVREWLGLTPAGANKIVARLESIGLLLREITGYARNRRFRFEPYLRLFEEPEEADHDCGPGLARAAGGER